MHELFPKKTIERLEKDALERYQLEEVMTNPEVIKRAQPSESLLKAVLRTKHLMNQEVLQVARDLVRRVIDEMMLKLARQIEAPFAGVRDRRKRSFIKIAKNFDAKTTLRRNLKNYDPSTRKLLIQTPHFYSRIRRQMDRWTLIILVDQSGSMVDSVIHAAITASILCGMKSVKPRLVAFDTNVVDLSDAAADPVETLMKVQLGGGTDIGHALKYAGSLIDDPRRTIVILISDFYEYEAGTGIMLSLIKEMIENGTKVLGLAALSADANPCYNRETASRMVALGAQVGAMTPGELATWIAEKVR